MLQRRVMNEQKKLFFLSISRHEVLLKIKKTCFINKASNKFKYTHLSVKAGELKLLI